MNLRIVATLAGGLLFPALLGRAAAGDTATADDPANPYYIISERNVFHLNPVPPPPEPEKPKEDLPIVKISGLVKIGNTSKALFSSTTKDKKDGPTYYSLAEGEKQGFLELVHIHADNGTAEIINSGVPMTLSLKDDSPKDSGAAPPPAAENAMQNRFHHGPFAPGMPGPGMPGPGGPGRVNLPGGRHEYPMRPVRQ